ncbi:hypothetical protein NEAUS03_1177 [Nematocida ausubeli]|nr:hypothetical protein NEAUS03_1177 [Nematocida ausubeli]
MHSVNEASSVEVSDNFVFVMDAEHAEIYSLETRKKEAVIPVDFDQLKTINGKVYTIRGTEIFEEIDIEGPNRRTAKIGDVKKGHSGIHISDDYIFVYSIDSSAGRLEVEMTPVANTESTRKSKSKSVGIDIGEARHLIWRDNEVYYITKGVLYGYSPLQSEPYEITQFTYTEVTCLEKTDNYFVVGTPNLLLIQNIKSKILCKVAWHSAPVQQIQKLHGDLIVSQNQSGSILLTDCRSHQNTFISTDYSVSREILDARPSEKRSFSVSQNGYIVIRTETEARIIHIPSKTSEYIYFLKKATKQIVAHELPCKNEEFVPTFNERSEKQFTHILNSNNLFMPESAIYHLDNKIIFIHKDSIYRVIEELVGIDEVFYSNGYVLVFLVEAQEKAIMSEKACEKVTGEKIARLYKLGKNTIERMFSGHVDLEEMKIVDMKVDTSVVLRLQEANSSHTVTREYEIKDLGFYLEYNN